MFKILCVFCSLYKEIPASFLFLPLITWFWTRYSNLPQRIIVWGQSLVEPYPKRALSRGVFSQPQRHQHRSHYKDIHPQTRNWLICSYRNCCQSIKKLCGVSVWINYINWILSLLLSCVQRTSDSTTQTIWMASVDTEPSETSVRSNIHWTVTDVFFQILLWSQGVWGYAI